MDIRAILMGVSFAFFWSSAFTSARVIVAGAPPLLALGFRFALAGLIAILLVEHIDFLPNIIADGLALTSCAEVF